MVRPCKKTREDELCKAGNGDGSWRWGEEGGFKEYTGTGVKEDSRETKYNEGIVWG